MDVMKTEPEGDPLALQTSDDADDMKPLPQKLLDLQLKVECEDSSYDVTSQNKLVETSDTILYSSLKHEVQEKSCDERTMEDDLDMEVITEEAEFSTDRINEQYEKNTGYTQSNKISSMEMLQRNNLECQEQNITPVNSEGIVQQEKSQIKFQCVGCNKYFATKRYMTRHSRFYCQPVKMLTNYKDLATSTLSNKDFPMTSIPKNECNNDKSKNYFTCDICGKGFPTSTSRKKHVLVHIVEKTLRKPKGQSHQEGNRVYKCSICGKGLASPKSLKQHQTIHAGKKLFKCDVCGMSRTTKQSLEEHIRRHLGVQPFKCYNCEKSFSALRSYQKHMVACRGGMPYECIICGKSLISKQSVEDHALTHINQNSKKIVVFPKCKTYFHVLD